MTSQTANIQFDKQENGGLGQLHPFEIQLIKKIRNEYRFGKVEIETRDGLPVYILKTIKREGLQG